MPGWKREGFPGLRNLAGNFQHSRYASVGGVGFLLTFVLGAVSGVALYWRFVIRITSSLLMFRTEIRHFCVVLWLGVSGMLPFGEDAW